MSIAQKTAKSLLSHEEWALVETTLRASVGQRDQADLRDAQKRLRDMRDKERDLSRTNRRVAKGRADPRGGSFPGTYAKPAERKQVFSQALIRVNDELVRRESVAAKAAARENQKRALDARRAAPQRRPANTATAAAGLSVRENPKAKTKVAGTKVGSVTKQTARSQARKDR
ncbi:hypothetical protein [Sandaracinobacteroides hominis]|uniref:hypothetical protein n=1 Tax=Sandaracinobacteroides hominis TaxID=2780086 RepID=UPI0018F3420F|nr:hypothetical protein [Sandaracinobacteroides hominis]